MTNTDVLFSKAAEHHAVIVLPEAAHGAGVHAVSKEGVSVSQLATRAQKRVLGISTY
jgi:hypothetical protein